MAETGNRLEYLVREWISKGHRYWANEVEGEFPHWRCTSDCSRSILLAFDMNLSDTSWLAAKWLFLRHFFIDGLDLKKMDRKGTLPWAIFRFRIFSNYFLQKFEKIKITVWKSDKLTVYGNFCLALYLYYYILKELPKKFDIWP